jgi:hypothetical protein
VLRLFLPYVHRQGLLTAGLSKAVEWPPSVLPARPHRAFVGDHEPPEMVGQSPLQMELIRVKLH